jgi:hypothetical protein
MLPHAARSSHWVLASRGAPLAEGPALRVVKAAPDDALAR